MTKETREGMKIIAAVTAAAIVFWALVCGTLRAIHAVDQEPAHTPSDWRR